MNAWLLPLLGLLGFCLDQACSSQGGEADKSPKRRRQEKEFTDLLFLEKDLLDSVHSYIALEEARLERLKTLAAEAPEGTRSVEFIRNPVNVFRLVNGLLRSPSLALMRDTSSFDKIVGPLEKRIPGREALAKAAREVFLLTDKGKATVDDIISGSLPDNTHAEPFTAMDCFVLGQLAYEEEDFYHAALFMEAADKLLSDQDPQELHFDVLDHLSHSYYRMGGNLQRTYFLIKNRILPIYPEHKRAGENVEYLTDEMKEAGLPVPTSEADLPPVSYKAGKKARANGKNGDTGPNPPP